MRDVVVIGGGLSGLLTAWRLQQAGRSVRVVEAREAAGGRIRAAGPPEDRVEVGPSWVWDSERHVHGLLRELGIGTFPHHREGLDVYDDGQQLQRGRLPRSAVPERRVRGGTHAIVEALAERVQDVITGCAAARIEVIEGGLRVQTSEGVEEARRVVAALPPALLARTVEVPELDGRTAQLLRHTPTWMADTAKVVVRYPTRFWTEHGLSGRAASRAGPLVELHDLSGPDGVRPALFGFVPRALATSGWEERIVPQLVRLFGPAAASPVAVHAQAWWADPTTTVQDPPGGTPRLLGHPDLRRPLLDRRLHLVSTETSGTSPGHMDGAVERAEAVARALLAS